MELLVLSIVILLGFIIQVYINLDLKSKVNKQQEQINELNKKVSGQLEVLSQNTNNTKELVDISKQIALKVISIEERVDNLYKSSK